MNEHQAGQGLRGYSVVTPQPLRGTKVLRQNPKHMGWIMHPLASMYGDVEEMLQALKQRNPDLPLLSQLIYHRDHHHHPLAILLGIDGRFYVGSGLGEGMTVGEYLDHVGAVLVYEDVHSAMAQLDLLCKE